MSKKCNTVKTQKNTKAYFARDSNTLCGFEVDSPKDLEAIKSTDENKELWEINSVAFYERPLTAFLTTLRTAALNMPISLSLISHQCRNFSSSSISIFLDLERTFPGLQKKLIYLLQ